MADGDSDGQRQKGDENNTGSVGKESNLPHKFLGEYLATEKRNMSRNKHKEPSLTSERERLYYYREERNPGSKQGQEQKEGTEGET